MISTRSEAKGGIKGSLMSIWSLIKNAFARWQEDKAPRLGAALAYYSILSLPPLLLIIIAIAGMIFGAEAVRGELLTEISGLVGDEGGKVVESMLASASKPSSGVVAAIAGTVTLLFGASGVFGELQDSLNTIWGVEAKSDQGFWGTIKDRFFSFTMVLGLAFLFLISLVVSTALTAVQAAAANVIPGPDILLSILNLLLTTAVITTLFAAMFKFLPDADVTWRSVWVGAIVTAILFMIGKYAIGMYLGKSNLASTYGAASSVIILLVWIYYAAQILIFGAEFTQAYATSVGDFRVPEKGAVPETKGVERLPHDTHLEPSHALPHLSLEEEERHNALEGLSVVEGVSRRDSERWADVLLVVTAASAMMAVDRVWSFVRGPRRGRSYS